MSEEIKVSPSEYLSTVQELNQDGFELMVDLTVVDWFRKREPRFELVV